MGCVVSCFSCASSFFYRAKKRELGPILYDRQSETLIREKLPISTWLENGIMYSRPLDIIDRTKFIRKQLKSENISSEHENHTYASAGKIPSFVDFYNIKMEDFVQENPSSYKTFNDFFIREVKPEKRPVAEVDNDAVIVSAADCRMTVFDSVEDAHKLFIKGKTFNLHHLIEKNAREEDSEKIADIKSWISENLSMTNFRLSPMDYHRFHSPVSGTVISIHHIEGQYFTTEPKALESDIDVLGENARVVVVIQTENHGKVLFIPISAEAVGKCHIFITEGEEVTKGDEVGYFDYGGSDIVAVYQNAITWDEDVYSYSQKEIETLTHVNERIGMFIS